jgi:hypothetical protein
MTDTIRRRSLPDSLRWLADKLDSDTLSDAERLGVALALQTIADEITNVGPAGPGRETTE